MANSTEHLDSEALIEISSAEVQHQSTQSHYPVGLLPLGLYLTFESYCQNNFSLEVPQLVEPGSSHAKVKGCKL